MMPLGDNCKHELPRHLCMECGASMRAEWSEPATADDLYDCQHGHDMRFCLECADIDFDVLYKVPPPSTLIAGAGDRRSRHEVTHTLWQDGEIVACWSPVTGKQLPIEHGYEHSIQRARSLGLVNERGKLDET